MINAIKRFMKDESGLETVEWAIVGGLILATTAGIFATIGDNVVVSSHTLICSLVRIEDDVFIGHGVMTINDIDPPSFRRTGSTEHWKPTLIRKGAVIGSNATLFPVVIGRNAVVGAGAVVLSDVPDNHVAVGNPAKILKRKEE